MDILALAALAPPRRKTVDFYGTRALDRSMPTSTSTRVEDVDVADVARADLGLERFPSSTTARGKDVADDGGDDVLMDVLRANCPEARGAGRGGVAMKRGSRSNARSRFVDFATYDDALRRREGEFRSRARTAVMRWWVTSACKPPRVRREREELRMEFLELERARNASMAPTTKRKTKSTNLTAAATTTTTTTTTRENEKSMLPSNASGVACVNSSKGRLEPARQRPYYHSRTFVAMDAAPREDSDDEDPIPRELAEDEALLNEFVDYSREEIDFMLAWNAVSRRYRALRDDDVPGLLKAFVRAHIERLRSSQRFHHMFLTAATAMFEHGVVHRQGIVDALKFVRDGKNVAMFEPPTPRPPTQPIDAFSASLAWRDIERDDTSVRTKPAPVMRYPTTVKPKTSVAAVPGRGGEPTQRATTRATARDAKKPRNLQKKQGTSKKLQIARKGPCGFCHATHTPQWRKGPRHASVLCNSCGMRWSRSLVGKRPHRAPPPAAASPVTPSTDDEHWHRTNPFDGAADPPKYVFITD